MIDVDALERAAKAATPGPWFIEKPVGAPNETFAPGMIIAATGRGQGIYADPPDGSFPAADREYIAAANPDTTLSLIAEIRGLRERVKSAEAALKAAVNLIDNHLPDERDDEIKTDTFIGERTGCSRAFQMAIRNAYSLAAVHFARFQPGKTDE